MATVVEGIPGVASLWEKTKGDPRVCVALMDGPVVTSHEAFKGSRLVQVENSWHGGPKEAEAFCRHHATHIASIVFGQHEGPVKGLAPRCRGLSIPVAFDMATLLSPLDLVRAIDIALDAGANIIHAAACIPNQTGRADPLLERAIRRCAESNLLVVAPGGNDNGECWCFPAVLPGVLAVGALNADGVPFKFNNRGGRYEGQCVLAPGENILGALWSGGVELQKGSSCAAPIVSGIAALLMSRQLQESGAIDAAAIRDAILASATPCAAGETDDERPCLAGKLNVPGAERILFGGSAAPCVASAEPAHGAAQATAASIAASAAPPLVGGLVFVIGNLGYDFGTEARRDSYQQRMPPADVGGGLLVPPNPHDPAQMAHYLAADFAESDSLIWTLNLELTPIYAIAPRGAFAREVHQRLAQILASQVADPTDNSFVERLSLPGRMTEETVRLYSGQVVPVVEVRNVRAFYSWNVNVLARNAVQALQLRDPGVEAAAVERLLRTFLDRVYFDLRNLGFASPDRALNYAATNAFQAAEVFAQAVAAGMELDDIVVEKSPFCRLYSNCWDVRLKFFDPENVRRARHVYRYTIDVSDVTPVTLGATRSWPTSA
jgi:cyclic patellamide precursor peptide PatG/subtilase family protein